MALSYFTESEAPRDFRVSSTESDGHYKKCLLCYTVKRNFYCPECIRAGNFVHSSMPYSDRFAEKQAKLLRLKANRRHVLDRCEKLLSPKIRRDTLLTEAKQSRDKIDLLRLAIEQRRNNIEERKRELTDLISSNNELKLKLPRYQKRVSSLGKHAQSQRIELQNKICKYNDLAEALAAIRRSRIRQLTKYIFPIYMTYDSSDSIEDLEFVGEDVLAEEPPPRSQLHVVAPWISADADFAHLQSWVSANKEAPLAPAADPLQRSAAAAALLAQLAALLAAILDVRLPHALNLAEYCNWRVSPPGLSRRVAVLGACAAALCARAGLPLSRPPLLGIHALCLAAAADTRPLGRVEGWVSRSVGEAWEAMGPLAGAGVGVGDTDDGEGEPEHLVWPENNEIEELSCTPPQPPASLVTSAAASLVSMWRGWTK